MPALCPRESYLEAPRMGLHTLGDPQLQRASLLHAAEMLPLSLLIGKTMREGAVSKEPLQSFLRLSQGPANWPQARCGLPTVFAQPRS